MYEPLNKIVTSVSNNTLNKYDKTMDVKKQIEKIQKKIEPPI